jgi:hypothetical protein
MFSFVSNVSAQEWIFNLKLNYRPVNWLTYRNSTTEIDNSGTFYNFMKVKFTPFYYFEERVELIGEENVVFNNEKKKFYRLMHPRFFEGEISIDLYRYSKSLLFGLGWSSNQGMVFSGVFTNGSYTLQNNTFNVHSGIAESIIFRSHQFYAYVDKFLGKETACLRHHFLGGLAVNVLTGGNIQDQNRIINFFMDNHNGYEIVTNRQINRVYPSILFKYEFEFRDKKGRNILGLNISYNQGLMVVYEHSVTSSFVSGESFTSFSKSRGSGFRLGISKSFNLKGKPVLILE